MKKTVFVRTFGCSANINNSELMAGLLEKAGFEIMDSVKKADCVVVNTCVVKGPTENKVISEIKKIPKTKRLVVAGCMPLAEKGLLKELVPDASLIGCNVKDVVEAVKGSKRVEIFRRQIKLGLPKQNKSKLTGIIQISEGCNGDCAYCIVKLAKGKLVSYPQKKIVEEVENSVKAGRREIWLTSQDCAAYGSGLAGLMKKVCSVRGDFKVRVGMMNPNNVLLILDELIDAYKDDKVFKFLHLPVQSGNDEILRKMNRGYRAEDFRKVISVFRKNIPDITISTDIIAGFPGETEKQFMDSLKLVKEVKPDVLNISRFWPRPGTKAAKMPGQVNGRVTKERSKILTRIFEKAALKKNRAWVKWRGQVLIDEKGKKGVVGRNFAYRPVVLAEPGPIGRKALVEVFDVTPHYFLAKKIALCDDII